MNGSTTLSHSPETRIWGISSIRRQQQSSQDFLSRNVFSLELLQTFHACDILQQEVQRWAVCHKGKSSSLYSETSSVAPYFSWCRKHTSITFAMFLMTQNNSDLILFSRLVAHFLNPSLQCIGTSAFTSRQSFQYWAVLSEICGYDFEWFWYNFRLEKKPRVTYSKQTR